MTQQRSIETVRVALGSRSYEVLIGSGLLGAALEHITQHLGGTPRTFIVTDENLAHTHLDQLQAVLSAHNGLRGTMVLPAGESTKCFAQLEALCAEILAAGVERDDCIVALGGGVIGDLAGFAAAIVRRGLRYVQLPTSLLAQVDSSVGGKTAINTGHGKNLIGAFHQPHLVLADIDVLSTLPAREMHAGYGEVAKYGLLGDRDFFDWLDGNVERIFARDTAALAYAVRRSIDMKAEIVARDETEQGDRALLNLGHTFGHALEAWTGYSTALLHGESRIHRHVPCVPAVGGIGSLRATNRCPGHRSSEACRASH